MPADISPPAIDPATLERLIALETRIAYQDRLLAVLDGVVTEFAARVETLERRLATLTRSLDSGAGPADEPPPHY